MWQHFPKAKGVHLARDGYAAAGGVTPGAHLAAGHLGCIGHERRSGVTPNAVLAYCNKGRPVAGHQSQSVMANRGSRPQQDHGKGLKWYAVFAGVQRAVGGGRALSAEAQRAVAHRECAAGQPQQTVAVRMGNPCRFKS